MNPYWEDPDSGLQLYHGDCREILPALGIQADLIVADPPFGETSLGWDRWPTGWLKVAAAHASSLWCFGSQRMFFDHLDEFRADWTLSQDVIGHDDNGQPITGDVNVVWEKHNGSGFHADRFKRVHEHAVQFYRADAPWDGVFNEVQTTPDATPRTVRRKKRPTHTGNIAASAYVSEDGGPRIMRSVIPMRSMHGRAIHPTEKPAPLLEILIATSCPAGGRVGDFFAGSGAAGEACQMLGRDYVGTEIDPAMAAKAQARLQQSLFGRAA